MEEVALHCNEDTTRAGGRGKGSDLRAEGAGRGAARLRFDACALCRCHPFRDSSEMDCAPEHQLVGAPCANAGGIGRLQIHADTMHGPEDHVPCVQPGRPVVHEP